MPLPRLGPGDPGAYPRLGPGDPGAYPRLGWKEEAALPEWGIERLRVKLDSGARTSAIHVAHQEVIGEYALDGQRLPVMRLTIPLSRRFPDRLAHVETPVVGYAVVRDTGARAERRPVVRTRLVCGPLDTDIAVTVTDRSGMLFRMIVGREALAGRVLVDPGQTWLAGRTRTAQPRNPRAKTRRMHT